MSKSYIDSELLATADLLQRSVDSNISSQAVLLAEKIISSLSGGGKVIFAGNGGSAADAQHMAAEFVNYFSFPREPLSAIALTTDTSILTSISNDSNFEYVFSRQVKALGKSNDVLWLYTTSGNSKNILEAAKAGKEKGMFVASFVGENASLIQHVSDLVISVPSSQTPKIQEVHLALGHAISGLVEKAFFEKSE